MKTFEQLSERQRKMLRFMSGYVNSQGYPPSIREIGDAAGISSTSVVNYNLNKLVQAGFLGRQQRVSRGLRLLKEIPGMILAQGVSGEGPQFPIPLLGRIVASEPVPVPEEALVEDHVDVPAAWLQQEDPSDIFALKVHGDSMIDAMIQDGDTVLLRRQPYADDGDMVAVWLLDRDETTLKHFYAEGKRIRLQPAHPMMDPIYVDAEQLLIQGKVLHVLRALH
ncbi:MAG: transcriptional repressor LexA [Anaerolineaceae bacterium]|nr:transcriptional repressor LexA [Anaerolineaceae bacterium]MCY3934520.1 transcriptional repressor LexA [Chloroflexota bacterium]MCY4009472.1 transcriptional repressor LexA [Anaerolineaceae bacterium]MCY4107350.1 transcriptional repressor LexA [Chloroflexota bacterium]